MKSDLFPALKGEDFNELTLSKDRKVYGHSFTCPHTDFASVRRHSPVSVIPTTKRIGIIVQKTTL